MGFGFKISKFLPGTNRTKTQVPPDGNDGLRPIISWRRRAVPQTGGQNYSLGNQRLPMYSLSGPLNTNAKRFNPLEPAPAIEVRRFANATIGGAGILNGQVFSQPLVNPDTGGFDAALIPINARPFAPFGIKPAGSA